MLQLVYRKIKWIDQGKGENLPNALVWQKKKNNTCKYKSILFIGIERDHTYFSDVNLLIQWKKKAACVIQDKLSYPSEASNWSLYSDGMIIFMEVYIYQ